MVSVPVGIRFYYKSDIEDAALEPSIALPLDTDVATVDFPAINARKSRLVFLDEQGRDVNRQLPLNLRVEETLRQMRSENDSAGPEPR